jgi:hypothetical protein
MRFTCVEPMVEWAVAFRGRLRNTVSGRSAGAELTLTWTRAMSVFSFGTDVSPKLTARALALETFSREWGDELKAAHQEHYEQFGATRGALTLAGNTIPVSGHGMRDRAFGQRRWSYMARYVSQYFYTGAHAERFFNVTLASLPALSNAKFGFVLDREQGKDQDRAAPVDFMSGDFPSLCADGTPPKELWLAFVADDITYTMKCSVEDGDTLPLDMGPGGMLVNLRFATYEISWVDPRYGTLRCEKGFGASEFGYRFQGADPGKPSLADLKWLPVTLEELKH